jgi:nucleoside-diphosphate-sugar epimerase
MESVVVTSDEEVQGLVRQADPQVVFHLATHYVKEHVPGDVPLLIQSNIAFGTHVLEGLRDTSAVVVSAMSFFQFRAGIPAPFSLYSATKQAFFDISEYYRSVAGLDIRQVILYDTFGPGDTRSKLVPLLLAALKEERSVGLGPAAQQINLLYVDDVVSGLIATAEGKQEPVLCVRSPQNVTVGEVVRTVGEVAGSPVRCTFDETAEVTDHVLRAGSWPAPTGWDSQRTLADGLERTWRLSNG